MNKMFSTPSFGTIAVGAALALTSAAAEAATIYASSAEIIFDGPRGSANNRNIIENAFGAADGNFFELGNSAMIEFQFGDPTGQFFFGPGSVVEITYGNNPSNWKEAVQIEVGLKGDEASFEAAEPNPFTNFSGSNTFTFDGIFNTVRLTDVTYEYFPRTNSTASRAGGFDVDAIGVSPVPVPAAGLLLLTALGGATAMRRRKKGTSA